MRSIVLLSRRPFFSFYLPLLREALRRFMDEAADPALLQTLVEALNGLSKSSALHLSLWGAQHEVAMPTLPKDHFAGASLLLLVQRFREDTMLLWWALLVPTPSSLTRHARCCGMWRVACVHCTSTRMGRLCTRSYAPAMSWSRLSGPQLCGEPRLAIGCLDPCCLKRACVASTTPATWASGDNLHTRPRSFSRNRACFRHR